jgi:hypothetical protein
VTVAADTALAVLNGNGTLASIIDAISGLRPRRHRIINNANWLGSDNGAIAAFDTITDIIAGDTSWTHQTQREHAIRNWAAHTGRHLPDDNEPHILFYTHSHLPLFALPHLVSAFWAAGSIHSALCQRVRNGRHDGPSLLLAIPVTATPHTITELTDHDIVPYILGEVTADHTADILTTALALADDAHRCNPSNLAHVLRTATALRAPAT